MEKLVIFVSSIIAELRDERRVVKEAAESLRMFRPWVFEYSPATTDTVEDTYLSKVRECDIFILLVAENISDPVKREYQEAVVHGKPRLVFLKEVQRARETQVFVDQIDDVKWVKFSSSDDLKRQVRLALRHELVTAHRRYHLQPAQVEELSQFAPPVHPSIPVVRGFVGRKEELSRLRRAFEESNLIAIGGIGGVGKTYLAAHFARELDQAYRVLWLPCKGRLTLEAFMSILGQFAETQGEAALQHLCEDTDRKPEQKLVDVMRLLGRQSYVFFLDDYHLVTDEKMHDFIKNVDMWASEVRVILTTRAMTRRLRELFPHLVEVMLHGLAPEDAKEYLRNLGLHEDERTLARIAARLEGHPLWLQLFVSHAIRYRYEAEELLEEVPEVIGDALLERVDAELQENERRFVERFAVFRNPVPREALAYVYEAADSRQLEQSLIDKFLITFSVDNELAMHDVVREFYYQRLPDKEATHLGAGTYYLEVEADTVEGQLQSKLEAHYHFTKARAYQRAAEVVQSVAELAYLGEHRYRRQELLLELLEATVETAEEPNPWLYLHRARILRFVGRTDEGWESLHRAKAGFERLGDRYGLATAQRVEGCFYHFAGHYGKAIQRFHSCLEAFAALGEKRDEAITLKRIGETLRLKSEYARGVETYRKGLEIFDSLGDATESAWMVLGLGGIIREQGKYPEAMAFYEDAKRRFRELDNPHGMALTLYGIGDVHGFEDRLPQALTTYEEAFALAEKLHDADLMWHLRTEIAKVLRLMGEYDRALSMLQESLEGLQAIGNQAGVAYASRYLGDTYRAMGKRDEALACLFDSLEIDEEIRGLKGLAEDHHWIGEIYEEQGNLALGLEHIQKAFGFYERMDFEPGIKATQEALVRIRLEQHLRKHDATSASWSSGAKMGVGTAYTYELASEEDPSKVWFTLTDGAITEVMYPTIDTANVKEIVCLVSDGKSFVHDETEDCLHTVSFIGNQSLAYEVTSADKQGRYRLVKQVVTDPARHTLVMQVAFKALQGKAADYRMYVYYMPHVRNSGQGDSGRIDQESEAIIAWDGDIYTALKVSPHWRHVSLRNILADHALSAATSPGQPSEQIENSRISFVLEVPTEEPWTAALGFGRSAQAAIDTADASLTRGFEPIKQAYVAGWQKYCRSLHALNGGGNHLYYLSAMVIKAHEDKTHRGAIVGSLSLPWGNCRPDKEEYVGYRYVWPRDLYHAAMALLAAGDSRTVADVLSYLDEVLQKHDGSFPQNAYVDGTPYCQSIQMDQVAYPIIIAWKLAATDRYHSLVKPAADYLVTYGPATPQDRWEEHHGYSPATLAAEIAGLTCAAELAKRAGDDQSAETYLAVADAWQQNLEKWCFTTNGPIGDGRYYLRISPQGDPNTDDTITLAHGGGLHDQREVIDPSFLELVRLGVKDAEDPYVVESIAKIDQTIKVVTPRGPSWHRYNLDGYGELKGGETFPGKGHLWTLLTGERGVYEFARGHQDEAKLCLQSMERFSNEGGMLPEQVWEETGEGTGSATPLVWSHAEYIILLSSILTGKIPDRPAVVYSRYVKGER